MSNKKPPRVLEKYKIEKPFENNKNNRHKRKIFQVNFSKTKKFLSSHKFRDIFIIVSAIIFFTLIIISGLVSEDMSETSPTVAYESNKNNFPELSEPKNIKYDWSYKGKDYDLTMTLYKSVNDYYSSLESGLYENYNYNEPFNKTSVDRASYKKYIDIPEEDKSVEELVSKIKEIASKDGLGEDNTLEMASSFVQGIPYDNKKASSNDINDYDPRYPYEVLYDNTGVCSGKSFLMYIITQELGYGSSLFIYNDEEHMASGVKCNKEYSTKGTSYCVIETTNYLRIGVEGEIDSSNKQATTLTPISLYENDDDKVSKDNNLLSAPLVILGEEGKEYDNVKELYSLQKEINSYVSSINHTKGIINSLEKEINLLKDDLDHYESTGNDFLYNITVDEYNSAVRRHGNEINSYNNKVEKYNIIITKWNTY